MINVISEVNRSGAEPHETGVSAVLRKFSGGVGYRRRCVKFNALKALLISGFFAEPVNSFH
ncbi:hypothetical protein, partial [Burkholderia multivorans]|uniref:hypothetical protein n=1 Tax=Burkholderia multivorans TaxID=87883 RepID=UPI001955297A